MRFLMFCRTLRLSTSRGVTSSGPPELAKKCRCLIIILTMRSVSPTAMTMSLVFWLSEGLSLLVLAGTEKADSQSSETMLTRASDRHTSWLDSCLGGTGLSWLGEANKVPCLNKDLRLGDWDEVSAEPADVPAGAGPDTFRENGNGDWGGREPSQGRK